MNQVSAGGLAMLALRGEVGVTLLLGLLFAPAATLALVGFYAVLLFGLALWNWGSAAARWMCRPASERPLSARESAREDARRKALGY